MLVYAVASDYRSMVEEYMKNLHLYCSQLDGTVGSKKGLATNLTGLKSVL